MNSRYRLAIYALLLTLLTNEVISLARVDNWSQRSSNTSQQNNWNYGGATQNNQQGAGYPSAAGNQWTGGRYNQTYGNSNPTRQPPYAGSGQASHLPGGQWAGAGRSNHTYPQNYPTNQPARPWAQNNQTTHYQPGQNPQGANWNQYNRNTTRPNGPNANWQPQPNSNWRPQSGYNTTYRQTPTTPSNARNNIGWNSNSNANNNYNSSYGGAQGHMANQPRYTGANVRPQNQSNPAWGGNPSNNPLWYALQPGNISSPHNPTHQPSTPNHAPGNGIGTWTQHGSGGGAAPAPFGGSNNQWNGNNVPNTGGGAAPLAPLGGGPTANNGNGQWNTGNNNWAQPGNPGGSGGGAPLAPIGGSSQWNGGGGQASLSYGNGQQSNSFGGAGQQRPAANGDSSHPYANLLANIN